MQQRGVISSVRPGTLAARLGLNPGDCLLAVNGQPLADIIDLSFALADNYFNLDVETSAGVQRRYTVKKKPREELGIEFQSAVFDRTRCCANRCLFCFVDQMPAGMRPSLYVKDDDYRLSFLYGNFITLTNLTEQDLARIKRLHLSPLYVSIHATDPTVRTQLLQNPNACRVTEQIQSLIEIGVELHAQIVLCPGINDGDILLKTFNDLYALQPSILSMAIVPVGLTRYRDKCPSLTGFDAATAAQVIDQVSEWQQKCREQMGTTFVYLADEFYLTAGRSVPDTACYDEFPQLENGVGLVRCFLDEWQQGSLSGGYESPLVLDLICGLSAAKVLEPLLKQVDIPGLTLRLLPVENQFFGSAITVSGLLTGQDILAALRVAGSSRDGVIIPKAALRKDEERFLDDASLAELQQALAVPVRAAESAAELKQLLAHWA